MRYVAAMVYDLLALKKVCGLFEQQGLTSNLLPLRQWNKYVWTLQGSFAIVVDEVSAKFNQADECVMDLEEYILDGLHGPRVLFLVKKGDLHLANQVNGRREIRIYQLSEPNEPLDRDFVQDFCDVSLNALVEVV